jgi:hypothetical protein
MKLRFTVEVEFEDKVVDDNEINDVADSILSGLVNEVNTGGGLAPVDSETFTKEITVSKQVVNPIDEYSVSKKFI